MLSFFGVVDLCATLPSLLEIITPLSSSRGVRIELVLRLLRVFRVLQWAGLNAEADALKDALWTARRKVAVFLIFIMVIVTMLGTLVYIVEDPRSGFTSIPRSIYWAIVTLTTVGYGDISPQTVPGQALASMMMVCGYSLLAVPTGIAAAEYSLSSASDVHGRSGHTSTRSKPKAAGYSWQNTAVVPARVCTVCQEAGHDADAAFCKHCGSELNAHVA